MNNNLNQNNMQQTLNTKVPTPQNISKWSLGRKEVLAKNEYLMNQLDLKNLVIKNLNKTIDELKLRVKLNGMEIPESLSKAIEVNFEFELRNSDDESLTYNVSNNELDYNTNVEVYYCDIIEHFKGNNITEGELREYIKENICESLYF